MGDVLLSRIIKYLNGTLFYDGYYQFCTFVIANSSKIIKYELSWFIQIDWSKWLWYFYG